MTFPLCNQADLLVRGARIVRERRRWDTEGYEQTQRRNGAYRCPDCGLWWPVIEEPCAWEEMDRAAKTAPDLGELRKWRAIEWEGWPVCEICGLLMVDQPDGTSEVYQL